jgi:hypothetical protein
MAAAATDSCLNCGAPSAGPYCAACGQRRADLDPTFHDLLHDASHELTHWEGKVPGTLVALFLHPGRLTVDFLAGRRARWLSPLRLYLICSVAYFLSVPLAQSATAALGSDAADTVIGLGAFGYIAWCGLLCARAVYGDSWVTTSAKVAVIAVVYGACLFAGSLGVMAYAIATT